MTVDDASAPRLIVTGPAEQVGLVLSLSRPQMVIGHSETADLVLEDRFVSRRHALVTVDPSGAVTITDLNSTGGTFVNGEPLEGPRVLRPGDLVQFADLVARFEPATAPRASVPTGDAATQILPVPGDMNATHGQDTAVTGSAAGRDRPSVADAPTSGPATPVQGSGIPEGPTSGGQPSGPSATGSSSYTVTGTVLSPALPGAGGLTVQLVDKNVGGDQVLASTQTGSDGSYAFNQVVISPAYLREHHKTQPDLQVQVPAGSSVLATSAVSYSAPTTVSLDVVLPAGAQGLPSEYETLTANLAAVYPGSLGSLKEDAAQQDITYLANKTGWDARAVALAALADQFSQITAPAPAPETNADAKQTQPWPVPTTSIRPEFYYALFRAGLPANPDSLFRTGPATAQQIWEQAVTSGVIPQTLAKEVPAATASFQALSAARSLDAPPAGLSTLREMLQTTLPETAQQDRFAQLYAQYQGDWPSFWRAVEQALGSQAATQLQLTGQLYYLTADNQPLVAALMHAEATDALLSTTLDLVTRGYYDPAMWAPLIGTAIPPEIPGADADEQASNYAQLLAAQVRLAYPTAVVADQVRRNIVPIADTADVATDVADFLTTHQGDFEIGVQPVEAYIASTGLTGTPAGVITQIKRIQRVYQLTPDDTSLAVLLRHNLDSAFAITRYDSAGFVRALGGQLGGADKATMIHARARQVFATTLSVTVAYLSGRAGPDARRRVTRPLRLSAAVGAVRLPGDRLPHARGPVRITRLLQLLGLRLDPEPRGLSGRPAATTSISPRRLAAAVNPAGHPAPAPAGSAVPAADAARTPTPRCPTSTSSTRRWSTSSPTACRSRATRATTPVTRLRLPS